MCARGYLGRLVVSLVFALPGFCAAEIEYSVERLPEYDAPFERDSGWTGGDGVFSVGLKDDVTLWLFSDTWIGDVVDGRHSNAKMVNVIKAI